MREIQGRLIMSFSALAVMTLIHFLIVLPLGFPSGGLGFFIAILYLIQVVVITTISSLSILINLYACSAFNGLIR